MHLKYRKYFNNKFWKGTIPQMLAFAGSFLCAGLQGMGGEEI